MNFWRFVLILVTFTPVWVQAQPQKVGKYNILFIISDDLTSTALGCYDNRVCKTPNIDRLAERGTLFQRAYCQFPVCGPSRASLMNGYYPHATQVFGYVSGRAAIGDRTTWAQHFKEAGYHTTRVSKIFHMGVPGDIEKGSDGTDDPISWNERYNSPGPEWKAKGKGETLENNPDGKKPAVGGNTFVVVAAEGDDLVHSDGKTAQKAAELLKKQPKDQRFFLAVGFVRPHVPFVAPAPYFAPYPHEQMKLPPKVAGDWDDIPPAGINYKTSTNMKMDIPKQKKAVGGYYAAVSYMDTMVGQVLAALKEAKLEDNTIVIFTSDHGYHLGEHDFWAKVSVHEESAKVPLIVAIPGQKPAVCNSFVELLDLFPTTSELCGLPVPNRLQGKSLAKMIVDPTHQVRDEIFCVNGKGLLIRTDRWAYIQYGEDGKGGMELFDMHKDPSQYTNLAHSADHQKTLQDMQERLKKKLQSVRENDLPPPKKKK